MTLLAASVVDITLVLLVVLLALTLLRRCSAALRHAVLAVAILAAAATPLLERWLPAVPIVAWPSSSTLTSTGAVWGDANALSGATLTTPPDDVTAVSWPLALLAIWMLGSLASAAALATGLIRLQRIARRSAPVNTGRWRAQADDISRAWALTRRVRILQSADPSLLVSYGTWRPTIVLPAGAEHWSDARIHVVLLHELSHIRRKDSATQCAAEILRAAQWFNPVVWLAARALRHESECACDDAVLREQIDATDYATHLLEVARSASRPGYVYAAASAIAHPSTLERRISAVLNHQRPRRPLTRRGRLAACVAVLAVAVPLTAAGLASNSSTPTSATADVTLTAARADASNARSAITASPTAAGANGRAGVVLGAPRATAPVAEKTQSRNVPNQNPGVVSGSIVDQFGGALPGVSLTLTDTQFGGKRNAVSDGVGRFAFREVVPSGYELNASLPGFRSVTITMPVAAGDTINRAFTLPVGLLSETITVVCSPAQATTPGSGVASASGWRALHDRVFAHVHYLATWIGNALTPALSAQAGIPVRVGGQLKAPRKVADVKPTCPATPIPGDGSVVILAGRIGLDGYMLELEPVRDPGDGQQPSELAELAMRAVREWRFTPTLLNGTPVEVSLSVTVAFKR